MGSAGPHMIGFFLKFNYENPTVKKSRGANLETSTSLSWAPTTIAKVKEV